MSSPRFTQKNFTNSVFTQCFTSFKPLSQPEAQQPGFGSSRQQYFPGTPPPAPNWGLLGWKLQQHSAIVPSKYRPKRGCLKNQALVRYRQLILGYARLLIFDAAVKQKTEEGWGRKSATAKQTNRKGNKTTQQKLHEQSEDSKAEGCGLLATAGLELKGQREICITMYHRLTPSRPQKSAGVSPPNPKNHFPVPNQIGFRKPPS